MVTHLFLCCLYFFQFSEVRHLLNLFRSLDLTQHNLFPKLFHKGNIIIVYFVGKEQIFLELLQRINQYKLLLPSHHG